jgi:transposase
MMVPDDRTSLARDARLALVVEPQRQMAAVTAHLEALPAEIERLTRGAKRQAAPFSQGTRVREPKPPGRQPGAGPVRHREAPASEAITEPPVDVPVTREACPTCGGPLEEARVDLA